MKALLLSLLLAAAAPQTGYSDWHRFEKKGVMDGHAAKGYMYINGAIASEPASDDPHKPWLMITCSTKRVFLDFYAGTAFAHSEKDDHAGTVHVQIDDQPEQAVPVTWQSAGNKSATLPPPFLKSLFGHDRMVIRFSAADGTPYMDAFHIAGLPRESVAKDCGKENVE